MHHAKHIIPWLIGAIIVGVAIWAFVSIGKKDAQTRSDDAGNWFTETHDELRAIGSTFH